MVPEKKNKIFTTIGSKATIDLLEKSDLLIRYSVSHIMLIPAGLEGEQGNYRRKARKIKMPVTSILTLRKGQRWLDIKTIAR